MITNGSNSSKRSKRSSHGCCGVRTFCITPHVRALRRSIAEAISVGCVAFILSGCAASVATDSEIASTENQESADVAYPYLRTQQASCDELKRSYDEGFKAGKEIVAAEFRIRSELNQPYVWQPPMISEVDMPARIVNGMMIPAHRELVIVRPGHWVRSE